MAYLLYNNIFTITLQQMLLGDVALGLVRTRSAMPTAAWNSFAIAPMCHPRRDNVNVALKPVR